MEDVTPRRRSLATWLPRTRKQFLALGIIAVALIVAIALPYYVSEYYALVIFQALEFLALAQAWNLLAGYGGLVSLAPAASVSART